MDRSMVINNFTQVLPEVKYEKVKESINMEVGLDVLKKMYTIHSPSGREDSLGEFLKNVLTEFGIPHVVGKQGEIYNIHPNRPLLCAHMDQVQRTRCAFTVQYYNFIYGMGGHRQAGLGADDKNGIWIILNLIKRFGDKVSFLFSTMEEVGGMTDSFMKELGKDVTDTIPYALIFDRKGKGDIIGVKNDYCGPDFEADLKEIGEEFGYAPTTGVWSDCDHISNYVPCVNLSCGYYDAHSDEEYTNVNELINSLDFGVKILETLEEKVYNRVIKEDKHDLIEWRRTASTWASKTSRLASAVYRYTEDEYEKPVSRVYDLWDWDGISEEDKKEYIENNTIVEYISEDDFLNDDYVIANYQHFEVIQGEDGFYLNTGDGELIGLTDLLELKIGTVLEVYISDKYRIVIANVDGGYDVYLENDADSKVEEVTYRDGRM